MFPSEFEYLRAENLEQALNWLQENEGAIVLAGGHSLIPILKMRLAEPSVLIDIRRISELAGISDEGDRIRIGALTTHSQIAASSLLRENCAVLAEAAARIADPQVRNMGTIGGNLAHADPGSDLPAVAVALEAEIELSSNGRKRAVSSREFFIDLMTTEIQPGEILTSIRFDRFEEATGSCYLKLEHPASGYAVCGVAAIVRLDAAGNCSRLRLAFNGVTAVPFAADAVSRALEGSSLRDDDIEEALSNHLEISDPMGDAFASGEYRLHLARVYARQALRQARDRAR